MKNEETRWPRRVFDSNREPHFLFVITPPYSGSTALAQLINTSHRTVFLHQRAEGQWLVPGLCEKDRWNPDKEVDYESVKSVWLSKYQDVTETSDDADVVIEKSPPNMMRMEELAKHFKSYSFLANNRNPYANCSSILYRNFPVDRLDSVDRLQIVEKLAAAWLKRSRRIRQLVSRFEIPLITYEAFCRSPYLLLSKLHLPTGVAETINPEAEVKVKDYRAQKIIDQNERQIDRLTAEERRLIGNVLSEEKDLLEFFNYEI